MKRIWEWRPDAAIALIVVSALSLPWLQEWVNRALMGPRPGTPQEWLVAMAAREDSQAVERALSRGISPDVHGAGGVTPLIAASFAGNARIVALLLEHGADPNGSDCCGNTPLMFAASGNRVEVIQLLLSHGADPAICNSYGRCAMDQAIDYSAHEAELLLRRSSAVAVIDCSRK